MKARRKGSLSWWILIALEKAVDGTVGINNFLNHPGPWGFGWDYPVKQSAIARALKRLRENGLVKEIKLKDDIIFKLTSAGEELTGYDPKEWDGKWRIVVFDIPEQKRLIRDLFRRNLKKWGFKHLQRSVWISKRDVFDKLTNYIQELGIEKWVSVIEYNKLIPQPVLTNM
ncbi:hypothetical protein HY386_02730 [Candidatus Daviesbacteria bacterium]|nr:hypothetical protein [Candidatus Daviesbacteria bacterium]